MRACDGNTERPTTRARSSIVLPLINISLSRSDIISDIICKASNFEQFAKENKQRGNHNKNTYVKWRHLSSDLVVKKGKVFPYSLPSVRPGADPGFSGTVINMLIIISRWVKGTLWFVATNTVHAYFSTRSKTLKSCATFLDRKNVFILHVTAS